MRALWIDEGAVVNWTTIAHYFPAFTAPRSRLYLSPRDPRTSFALLEEIRARGYDAGLYRATTWDAELDPAAWARLLSGNWSKLGGQDRFLPVQANIEKEHGLDWVEAFLIAWRKLRPGLETSWALEGFQGGWIERIRLQVLESRVRLAPETYGGRMDDPAQQWDVWGTVKDLVDHGFPANRIDPFLDGRRLDPTKRGWDGFVFTQARLP
jgi:hypothetical protein